MKDIKETNFYFLYAFQAGGSRFEMRTLQGDSIPFFKDKQHARHQFLYFWHSRGGALIAADFEYLYQLQKEYAADVDFWFINLTAADEQDEEAAARAFVQAHHLDPNTILLDTHGEAAETCSMRKFSTIVLLKKDNYVYDKHEGVFDIDAIKATLADMLAAPLHSDAR